MSILVYKDKTLAGAAASTVLAAQIIEKPACTLGLDYAEELLPAYRTLARMSRDGLLDWSDVRVFGLSERVRADEQNSIESQLDSALLSHVNLEKKNRFMPDADASDWSVVCSGFEDDILDAGGLDCVMLNIAPDGSVAFNIGAQEIAPVTHVERTAGGRVVTAGISTIMAARKIVALITGEDKADIACSIFHGPVTPLVPASYLQLHANAVFLLDDDAAKLI